MISSKATEAVLAQLAADFEARSARSVRLQSVGGVDAKRRVSEGETFDVVALASDAIDELLGAGHLLAGSKVDLVHSEVAIAVRKGAAHPDVASEDALRRAVLAARTVGRSTGPSGVEVMALFERWGIRGELEGRIVVAPPGVPVGALVERGDVELGFQQLSELLQLEGIEVLGTMPDPVRITTTFSAAIGAASTRPDAARELLDFLTSPAAVEAKRHNGMTAADPTQETTR
jgi:molybdate transport system substrate-binding protein